MGRPRRRAPPLRGVRAQDGLAGGRESLRESGQWEWEREWAGIRHVGQMKRYRCTRLLTDHWTIRSCFKSSNDGSAQLSAMP